MPTVKHFESQEEKLADKKTSKLAALNARCDPSESAFAELHDFALACQKGPTLDQIEDLNTATRNLWGAIRRKWVDAGPKGDKAIPSSEFLVGAFQECVRAATVFAKHTEFTSAANYLLSMIEWRSEVLSVLANRRLPLSKRQEQINKMLDDKARGS
jgi:hypothetical protein